MTRCSLLTTRAALMMVFLLPLAASGGTLTVAPGAASIGNYGLDVALGDCSSPDEVLLDSPASIGGAFEACTTLTATSVEVGGAGASFVAGREIVLGDGFSVAAGAAFSAALRPELPV